MSEKTVLLTGASGFVGRHILKSLSLRSVKVRLTVRNEQDKDSLKILSNVEKILITKDLFSESQVWLEGLCAGVDTIMHAAWVSDPGENILSSKNIDAMVGTLKLADAALKSGVRRFVGLGSCYEYDTSKDILSTKSSIGPDTLYGAAKVATYLTLSQYFKTKRIEFLWARIFFLYGEGESDRRLVAYVRKRLSAGQVANLSSGKQIRDYMDVKYAADNIVNFSFSEIQGVVNICSGKPVTVRQLVEEIADEYDGRELLNFGVRDIKDGQSDCIIGVPSLAPS
jgi:nucleoside-diphosphate-sugar epimerase